MKPTDDSRKGGVKDRFFLSFGKLKASVTSSLPSLRNKDDLKKLERKEDCSTIEFDSDDDVDFSSIFPSHSFVEKKQVPALSVSALEVGREVVSVVEDLDKKEAASLQLGQVSCIDYPHSRHACAIFPFEKAPHEICCELCYCFVCEIAAPCKKWFENHCDAFEIGRWSIKKQLKREAVERKKEAYKKHHHPRYMCVDFPYEKTTHDEHCELCYCYVCKTSAPCEKWVGSSNHCDAINNGKWRTERELRSNQNAPISEAGKISHQQQESNLVHQEHPQEGQTSQTRSTGSLVEGEHNEISAKTQVRVENLPVNVNDVELAALFQRAGFVEKAEIMFGDPLSGGCKISQGFGFVTMGTILEADKAVHLFNGSYFEKNVITVNRIKLHPSEKTNSIHTCLLENESNSNGSSIEGENDETFEVTKVHVGNLPLTINSQDLTELFYRAGDVTESEIMYDEPVPGGSRTSRGFGFVTMSTIEEADKAVHLFNGSYLEETPITVNRIKLSRHEDTYDIHVSLPCKMTKKGLKELFGEHGFNVMRAEMIKKGMRKTCGCGFGEMECLKCESWESEEGLVEMGSHWEREDVITSCLDGMNDDGCLDGHAK